MRHFGPAEPSPGSRQVRQALALGTGGLLLAVGAGFSAVQLSTGGFSLAAANDRHDPVVTPLQPAPTTAGEPTGGPAAAIPKTGRNPFDLPATSADTAGSASTPTPTPTPSPTPTTAAPSPTPTPSPAAAPPIYLGLYGWTTDAQAVFNVNDKPYTVAVGAIFGTDFTFVKKYTRLDGVLCATVKYRKAATELCQGSVVAVR